MDIKIGAQTVPSQSYLAFLPERTARAGAALAGGLVYEASEVVLPLAVRRSKLYQAIVGRLLRITVELVGGVEGVYPTEEMPARELLVRKTTGNAVELSSFLAVGWSPLWLLAGASDLVGGTKAYLRALVTELRDAGVLAPDADVASFEELLAVLEGTSGALADAVDVPPLNVPSVRTSWQELRRQAANLPDAAGLEKLFAELQLAAQQEDRSILEISSMVALGAVRTGVRLGSVHTFDYYRRALQTIVEEGLVSFLRRTSTPYLTRAGSHFDPRSSTHSERLLRRWADRRSRVGRQTPPRRPKHRTRKMPPPVADAKGSPAHLILNPAAGSTAAFLGRLTGAARERGIRVRVLEPGEDARLAALAAAEDGAESLAVAGGDGSVAAVAGVAVERDLPLVVVPTGTLNHFARDLGLDLARPLRALDAFGAGHERRVDVGRINGHPFINNVSLGVYAEMLDDPEYRRDKLRVAQAKLQAAFFDPELRRALRIAPPEELPLEGVVAVVVSNNPYEFARWDRLGQRRRLDTGTLQVSVLDVSTLDELERLLAGTLLGAPKFRPALRHWTSELLDMGVLGERVRAGVDGEPITFEAPLRFSVAPGGLRVLVPDGLPADRRVPPLEAGWRAARTLRRWLRPTPGPYEDRRSVDDN